MSPLSSCSWCVSKYLEEFFVSLKSSLLTDFFRFILGCRTVSVRGVVGGLWSSHVSLDLDRLCWRRFATGTPAACGFRCGVWKRLNAAVFVMDPIGPVAGELVAVWLLLVLVVVDSVMSRLISRLLAASADDTDELPWVAFVVTTDVDETELGVFIAWLRVEVSGVFCCVDDLDEEAPTPLLPLV